MRNHPSTSLSVYALSNPLSIVSSTDDTPPTLISFQDNKLGGPVLVAETVTYTVTFSKAMKASTLGSDDFENASTAAITVGSVAATANPAVFEIAVTPTGPGLLQLQVKPTAVITDLSDNLLDAGTASPDDTVIAVNSPPNLAGQFGILDVTANGGINPATGVAWAAGDAYRLVFVTSADTTCDSTDIATYNAFVQGLANAAGLGAATWNVVGSTATIDARDNTRTNPAAHGVGEPIFRMDGKFAIANNYADLWNGINSSHVAGENFLGVHLDEKGNERLSDRVRTGSDGNGVASADSARVLGGSAEGTPRVTTGRNHAPDFYGSLGGTNWMRDWSEPAASAGPVFAMSEPLTVIAPAGNTFADWIKGYDVGELDGFTDDPDGDGLANGLEAWFGTDPGVFNTGLVALDADGNTATFTHPQNANAPTDLSGFYQWSPNLTDWYAGDGVDGPPGGPTVNISPSTLGTTTTVTAIASGPLGALFLRAGVVR